MANHNKIANRRLRSAYLTTTISISLVLLIVGIIGFLGLNAEKLSNYVKENIGLTVYIKDETKQADINKLQKMLDAKPYVKSTELITKEQAAEILQKDLGEDFISFLGSNPLSASINVHFYADYAQLDSLSAIEKNLQSYAQVKEVVYQKDLVSLIDNNVRKISIILLIFGGLLFLTSYTLINNTIRLSVYSQRFIIRTMKLVGATKGFIRTPFLAKSMTMGFASSLLSISILFVMIYMLRNEFNGLVDFNDLKLLGILFIGIIIFGIIISFLATYFAINKYLRIKEQELYY
ncbi:MAG: cell division protein FtsX [Bacteroidales bacterium]|nr:cell division protein FtsX [Bacteroidales bacterium]